MVFVYALRLRQGKYYIGKTENPRSRLMEHINHAGSAWTTIYAPVELIEMIPNCDSYDEDKFTFKYLSKYGINNVRGGSFVSVRLSSAEKSILERICRGSSDQCFVCGGNDHFAEECDENSSDYSSGEEEDIECCSRCGRPSHLSNNCFANFHVDGYRLSQ
jgi:hypothetical protein